MSRPRWAALVVAVALSVAGCGAKSAGPVHPASPDAATGGTLRVGILPPRSIAPWLTSAYDAPGYLVVRTMCDPLASYDVTAGELRPAIALSWRSQGSADIIVKLRKGLAFNDGSPARVDDIITSLSRVADSDVASPVAEQLSPVLGYSALSGLHQETGAFAKRRKLVGLTPLTSHTLQVALNQADPDFVRLFGHALTAVVPARAFKHDPSGLEHQPVCIGPYRLEQPWRPGQDVITLVRSKAYYGSDSADTRGGRGWADRIEFHVFPKPTLLEAAFRGGGVDVAYGVGDSAPGAMAVPTPTVDFIGFPTTVAPFSTPFVRVALSLSLDRDQLSTSLFNGIRTPAQGFLPPTVGADYDKRPSKSPCSRSVPPTAMPQVARSLVASQLASLTKRRVRLYYNDLGDNARVVAAVARQWHAVLGLNIVPTALSDAAFVARATGAGFDGPFRYSWSPQVPSADTYLRPVFDSTGIGTDNWSRYNDPGVDFVLDSGARTQANDKARRSKYQLAEAQLCASMPMIPLLYGGRAVLVNTTHVGSALGTFGDRASGAVPLRELFVRGKS